MKMNKEIEAEYSAVERDIDGMREISPSRFLKNHPLMRGGKTSPSHWDGSNSCDSTYVVELQDKSLIRISNPNQEHYSGYITAVEQDYF